MRGDDRKAAEVMTAREFTIRAISRRAKELNLPDFTTDDAHSMADAVLASLTTAGFELEEREK